jgi:hypothetical protein
MTAWHLVLSTISFIALPADRVYYMPETSVSRMTPGGEIRFYGVSVEKVEEALKAIEYPNVQTVQIIFNIFRQRPSELFFIRALERKVGIFARLPLSSGMLTGKMKADSRFSSDDHRQYNRHGESFDAATFSGVDYTLATPLISAPHLIRLVMTEFALR